MMQLSEDDPREGARNLLLNCVGLRGSERLLLVCEDSRHGYYDDVAPQEVSEQARRLGARVESLMAPLIEGPEDFPREVAAAMAGADHTVFFSRIGDQVRFLALPGGGSKTMCYALDAGFLGSSFCRLPHGLMEEVKNRFEGKLEQAGEWRITCPLGTDCAGSFAAGDAENGEAEDFSLELFPVTTFRPVGCGSMSGRVALAHWLMATATHSYEPCEVMLEAPVFAVVEGGRIREFEGRPDLVARVRAHYDMVAAKFGLDRDIVHSWHAGINPKTFYPRPAAGELERWGGVSFASPRYLHFHTCGDYAPGEIAWSLFDATVLIDGEVYWRDGRFVFLDRPEVRGLLDDYGLPPDAFEARRDIGI